MAEGAQGTRRLRGAIVVTGSEVLAGRVTDKNGPWVSQQFAAYGVETAGIIQVGDRRDDLLKALAQASDWGVDLVATTGGLGPTADDLTIEVVAEYAGRTLTLDPELESRVWAIVQKILERYPDIDVESLRATTRKQAMQPLGAVPLEPVGTAPGSLVPPAEGRGDGPLVIVLPGPPRELQPMWRAAVGLEPLAGLLAQAAPFEERMLRLIGLPESDLAAALEEIEGGGVALDRLEITTCMRSGEIEIVTRYEPGDAPVYDELDAAIRERYGARLYSDDGAGVDEVVRRQLIEHGWTIGLAESCTGGLVASKLIEPAGASAYVRGGIVAYDNEVKVSALGVPAELIEEHGAVSEAVAIAMAQGAVERLGANCGVSTTGVAGPDGGTDEKPVGLVWVAAVVPGREPVARSLIIPGSRNAIRERAVTFALHTLRTAVEPD
ncbi:MAG: competence/damage-inducible protein A [Solirubrobacteraceae bacterium]|nr:competence/damage-inducible protein A [Solirubrobacteraceae bacterium]